MLRVLKVLIVIMLLASTFLPAAQSQAASANTTYQIAHTQAEEILNRMSAEERVGQLFLVTFQGTDTGPASQIYDLVVNHHVGGVILRSENNNIPSETGILQQLYSFNYSLQSIRYQASRTGVINPLTGVEFTPEYIPLFIGISQEGDGYPNNQI
ncbi:MAG: hypothetical protein JXR32_09545 [Anaerolineaceae bacterium]|nr:hypothetical protein [Anaerolineaceae bacterium]